MPADAKKANVIAPIDKTCLSNTELLIVCINLEHQSTLRTLFLQENWLSHRRRTASPPSMSAKSSIISYVRLTSLNKLPETIEMYLMTEGNPHRGYICFMNIISFWTPQKIFVTKPVQLQEKPKQGIKMFIMNTMLFLSL